MGNTRVFKITPVIVGSHVADDAMGAVLTLAGMGLSGGIINSVVLYDDANNKKIIDLIFYDALPGTAIADSAAWSVASGDKGKVIGMVRIQGSSQTSNHYITIASGDALAVVSGIGLQVPSTADGNIYAQMVLRETGTYAPGDLRLIIGFTP